jgi:hypothetical protein
MASRPWLMVRYRATAIIVNTKLLMISSGYVAMCFYEDWFSAHDLVMLNEQGAMYPPGRRKQSWRQTS